MAKSLELYCWEKSVPLINAPLKFAPPHLIEAYRQAHEKLAVQPLIDLGENQAAKEDQSQDSYMEVLSEIYKRNIAQTNSYNPIKDACLNYLRKSSLIAYGFEEPRRLADEPVEIPAAAWQQFHTFRTDMISYEGLKFIAVRVRTPRWNQKLAEMWREETGMPAPNGKRGPNSSARDIKEAFDDLVAKGQIASSQDRQSYYQLIRQWLEARYPNKGYSTAEIKPTNETIRKYTKQLFEMAKFNQ